jgi:AcrR family transcriptional regulator
MGSKTERTTAQGEASRRRILDATIALICSRGISRTSVNAICDEAGVAKTALYWHFDSKEGLLQVAMEEVAAVWVSKIQGQVVAAGSPNERLDHLVDGLKHIVQHESHLLQVIEAVRCEYGTVSEELKAAVRDIDQRSVDAMVSGFEDTLGMPLPDMDLLARTIIWMLLGVMRETQLNPEGTDIDRVFCDIRRTVEVLANDRFRRAAKAASK